MRNRETGALIVLESGLFFYLPDMRRIVCVSLLILSIGKDSRSELFLYSLFFHLFQEFTCLFEN